MKVKYKRFIFLQILLLIFVFSNCVEESTSTDSKSKDIITKFVVAKNTDQGYVIPQTTMHFEDPIIYDNSMTITQNHMITNGPMIQNHKITNGQMMQSPMMRHQITQTTSFLPQPHLPPFCPCAAEVRCKPCNGIAEPPLDMYSNSLASCPCAVLKSCAKCPPISLIHEIASRKAQQDQQLAYNLKTHSEKILKYFDMILKYTNDVVISENEAVKAAKEMEEASLKALFARKNMVNISEKARLIAKTSIVENRPCFGINCPGSSPENFGYFNEKIFPTEVDSVKEYMDNSFSTNVNGYNNGYNTLDSIENEADGKINIHKIHYNKNGNSGGLENRMQGNQNADFNGGNNQMNTQMNYQMTNQMNTQNQNSNNGQQGENINQNNLNNNNNNNGNNQMNNYNQNLNMNPQTGAIPNMSSAQMANGNSLNLNNGQVAKTNLRSY